MAFRTIVWDDSTWTVVRIDPSRPHFMEIIAHFYEEARAKDYAGLQNEKTSESPFAEEQKAHPAVPEHNTHRAVASGGELSSRQNAVLKTLREKMDENREVAVRAAALAQAAQIPLGSLHSVLGSLEKKGLIKTTRGGSARSPAVYQVL